MTQSDELIRDFREVVDSQVALGHKMTLVPTDRLAELLDRAALPSDSEPLRAALEEIDRWLDELDTVAVEWAPAHTAPYVSKSIIRPGIEAILNRHLRAALSDSASVDGIDVERTTSALAYALARAALPSDTETSREYAARLAPLVIESGWLSPSRKDVAE